MLGQRLRLAREAAGLRQIDVAQQLGIAESGVSEMESGRRQPKAAQLAVMARLYRRSIDFFFSEEAVAQDVVLWRGRPSEEDAAKRIQREFFSLCEDYRQLEDLTGSACVPCLTEERGTKERFGFPQAEGLAARIWREFDLGVAPAEGLRLVLEERYCVKVFALSLASDASAASARSARFGPAVLLNCDSVLWRRNFDLAHELFHLLTWNIFRGPLDQSSVEAGEDEESLANCFASRLLLPEGPFTQSLEPFLNKDGALSLTQSQLHDLARSFGVSADAVVYRCAGLLHWRKERTQQVLLQVRSCRMQRQSPPIERLPQRYVDMVAQAYRRGLISFAKGAEYLRMGYNEALSILEPPEDGLEPDRPISVAAD